jgi:siroheme synthase (precorrin-2 oxidase/ferrochelatase)
VLLPQQTKIERLAIEILEQVAVQHQRAGAPGPRVGLIPRQLQTALEAGTKARDLGSVCAPQDPDSHAYQLVVVAATLALAIRTYEPLRGVTYAQQNEFAGRVLRVLAELNGFEFDFDPAGQNWLCEMMRAEVADAKSLRMWLSRNLRRGTEFALPAPPTDAEPLRVFIAIPITERALNDSVYQLSQLTGIACLPLVDGTRLELVVYQPIIDNVDIDGAVAINRKDRSNLRSSDLLIVIHLRAADGLGVVITEAAPSGIPILVLAPEGQRLTPLIEGADGDLTILRYDDTQPNAGASGWQDGELVLRQFLAGRREDVLRHRDARLERRRRWTKRLADYRMVIRRFGTTALGGTWSDNQVTTALSDVNALAAAPADLVAVLSDALHAPDAAKSQTQRGRRLTYEELLAGVRAARIEQWDEAHLAHVLHYVTGLVGSGKTLVEFRNLDSWRNAARMLREQ